MENQPIWPDNKNNPKLFYAVGTIIETLKEGFQINFISEGGTDMLAGERIRIILVEDDPYYSKILSRYLNKLANSHRYADYKFDIKTYDNAKQAIKELDENVNIALIDYYLDDKDDAYTGMDVMKAVKSRCLDCKVVIISSQQNMVTTVELLKHGADDYIIKNASSLNRVWAVVQDMINREIAAG